jgi:hypothetical protein
MGIVISILRKKYREEKDRSEWALVTKKGGRVLKWFGPEKPSEERVKKEDNRVQMFKHMKGKKKGKKKKSSINLLKIAARIVEAKL